MKLRYYLRGLGIGMLVTALVFVLSGNKDAKMSDEAVKRRAAELGMVEKDKSVLGDVEVASGVSEKPDDEDDQVLSDVEVQPEDVLPEDTEAQDLENEEGTVADVQGSENESAGDMQGEEDGTVDDMQGNVDASAEDTENELAEKIEERADEVVDRAEEVAEGAVSGRSITFEVVRGDSSVSVARRVQEAGLVASAADFDVFLCQNGYDKRISTGRYELTMGMSEKEIADIITKSVR